MACTGTNWDYAVGGIAFHYAAGGATASAPAEINNNLARAEITGLVPATTYSIYASATTADGQQHRSAVGTFTTKEAPRTSHHGWLELPAKGGIDGASEVTAMASERNYTMYYDPAYYAARWVAYPLAKGHSGTLSRPSNWSAYPDIPTNQQINVWSGSYGVSYGSTEYARGHQIPNGDRNGNETMQKQTFYATNSTPQIQDGFNGSIWNALEGAIRGTIPSQDSLYVVTGPVYKTVGGTETVKMIKPQHDSKQCPVANYYYKVVLKVKRAANGTVTAASAIGFWFEHRRYDSGDSFTNYAVSVDEIERKTGFNFYANLPAEIERTAEQNTSWSRFQSF